MVLATEAEYGRNRCLAIFVLLLPGYRNVTGGWGVAQPGVMHSSPLQYIDGVM